MQTSLRGALTALAVGAGFIFSVASAQGATVTWDLSGGVAPPGTAVGTSHPFTAGGITITAFGFTNSSLTTPATLFEKNGGAGEIGLGLTNDPSMENEITGTNLIAINFVNAINAGLVPSSFDFQFNSTTGGESWAVLFSDTGAANDFHALTGGTGSDELVHMNLANHPFYEFMSTNGNVLLHEVSAVTAAVPEPATWAMMLLGFLGLGFAFRQSRRKVSFA
jgi:hypothetical protein